jgi:acyl dehydratase
VESVLDPVDTLQRFVGRPAGPPREAPRPVDRSAIANWCAALGDALPIYVDDRAAAASRWGAIVAPPTMLQTWTFPDRRTTPAPAPGPDEAEAELLAELHARGYTGTVATNSEQTYLEPVRLGDRLRSRATIAEIAGPKQTSIGEGWFVTLDTEHTRDDGTVVGTQRFRSFRYRAGRRTTPAPPPAPELPASPTVVLGRSVGTPPTSTRRAADVEVGEELPVLEVPITPTLVVATSIASGDFNVLHHDRDRARAAGAADIFLNILATNGLVGRYVAEWAGPDARFLRVALRLGVPNHPYDTLRLAGAVEEHGATTRLRVDGTNSLGSCVTATVEVGLP